MNRIIYSVLFMLVGVLGYGQVYLEEFDTDVSGQISVNDGYSSSISDGEWTITGDGTSGMFSVFTYTPADADGNPISIDVSENNKVFLRAKASSLGTQLRLDLQDANGFITSVAGLSRFLIADYTVYEFDFTGGLTDGGFGGTPCNDDNKPCDVDPTAISQFIFYVNPAQGGFSGSVIIDFLSVGTEPQVGPMSDVFQDHFDDTTSLRFISSSTPGYVNTIEESQWRIKGDGTNGMWEPVSMLTFNPTTLDTVDISVADGNDKVFIRMRSTVPGTSVRLDLQDINNFATTAGSITNVITDEFETYEFNYGGSYQDLAFGGTGCTQGGPPCDVDPSRIANMILFVNPGVEAFAGEVHIEYISVGTPLEIVDENNELAYGDHFSEDDTDFITTGGTYELNVSESILSISAEGGDAPFSNIGYTPHNEDGAVLVDATGNNKVFVRARSTAPNTLFRIDLIDTSNLATTQPSLTKILNEEWQVLEYNFSNQYFDAGFGGSGCEESSAPCPVDGTVIETLLLYPNPADGGFNGTIEVDYISFGTPLGEDIEVFKYADQFDDGDVSKFGTTGGIALSEADGFLTISGDGTSGMFGAFPYLPHDPETGEDLILDITSNNKVYMKAKASVPTTLRMDVEDADGFASTEPSTAVSLTEEFQILEFDFTGTYMDGGYGGTSCASENAPCSVDGTRISEFVFYVEPGVGLFAGEITVDWISTIDPLETDSVDLGPVGIDEYSDDFEANDLTFLSDNGGLTLSVADDIITITGDGTSGQFAPIGYALNDGVDSVIVNANSSEGKVFVRMKSSSDTTRMRIDLVDNRNFHTTLAGLEQTLTTEFEVYEYDYTAVFDDGGYGGTACVAGPCPVDPERVAGMQFYIDPGVGAFAGTVDIDWVSFGEPITSSVVDLEVADQASVYPNPAADEMYLVIDAKISGDMRATFYDITGRMVSTKSLGAINKGESSRILNVSDISEGMYFLQVTIDDKKAFFQKVFIK